MEVFDEEVADSETQSDYALEEIFKVIDLLSIPETVISSVEVAMETLQLRGSTQTRGLGRCCNDFRVDGHESGLRLDIYERYKHARDSNCGNIRRGTCR